MNKKIIFGIVFALVLLGVGGWYFYQTGTQIKNEATSEIQKSAEVTDTVQTGASSAMEQVNPFSAKVNPVEGYKNPFE
jgi:CHASE3 domain sensor protein